MDKNVRASFSLKRNQLFGLTHPTSMHAYECCLLRLHRCLYLVVSESMSLSLKIGLDTQANGELLFDETSGQPALRIDFQIQILLSSLLAAIGCLQSIAELSNQESEVSSAIDIATNLEAKPAGIGNDNESTIHQSDVSSAAYVISHWQHREDRSSSCNQTKASTYAENGDIDSSSTESTVKESHNSCASQHDRPVDLMEQSGSAHNIQNNPVESPYSLPTTQRKGAKVVNKSMTKAESALARLKAYETGDGEIQSKWQTHITNSACPQLETIRLIQMVEKLRAMGYCCVNEESKSHNKRNCKSATPHDNKRVEINMKPENPCKGGRSIFDGQKAGQDVCGYHKGHRKTNMWAEQLQKTDEESREQNSDDTDMNFQTVLWQSFELKQCPQTDVASDAASSSIQVYNSFSRFNGNLQSNNACQERFAELPQYCDSARTYGHRRKHGKTAVRKRADDKLAGQIHVAKRVIADSAVNHDARPPPPVDPPIPPPPADPPPHDPRLQTNKLDT